MTGRKEKVETEKLVNTVVFGMQEIKGHEIVALDLRKIPNAICSFFIICHGESTTQVGALADSVEKQCREKLMQKPLHREGYQNAEWIILDYFDVVVHVFHKKTREFYDLEKLWADAAVFPIKASK